MAFPNWTHTPIPGVSLSASGLLALADLSTVAQRTAITGGSSWLDSLLLAPGLHYQQAAEDLLKGNGAHALSDVSDGGVAVLEDKDGNEGTGRRIRIKNVATAAYLRRIANTRPGETVTLDVGSIPNHGRSWRWDLGWGGLVSRKKIKIKMRRSDSGMHAFFGAEEEDKEREKDDDDDDDGKEEELNLDLGWVSHLLYLASPVLTVIAAVLVVLLRDWWVLAQLLGLMTSRLLNIWVIKQRTKRQNNRKPKQQEPPLPEPSSLGPSHMSTTTTAAPSRVATPRPDLLFPQSHLPVIPQPQSAASKKEPITSYTISLPSCHTTSPSEGEGEGEDAPPTSVRLRGKPSDLEAITTSTWLRSKTHVEGYLEAMAKLVVYGVAAFSGNTSQTGAIIMMGLLLVTAGLLALSNSHAKSLTVNGRVVVDVAACGGKNKMKKMGDDGKGRTRTRFDEDGLSGKEEMENGKEKNGGIIEGQAVALEAGRNLDGRKDEEVEDDGRKHISEWPSVSSSRSGQNGGMPTGQVGLGLDGLDDTAADRAEKGEMRYSSGSLS